VLAVALHRICFGRLTDRQSLAMGTAAQLYIALFFRAA
jgi:hypothetical protein